MGHGRVKLAVSLIDAGLGLGAVRGSEHKGEERVLLDRRRSGAARWGWCRRIVHELVTVMRCCCCNVWWFPLILTPAASAAHSIFYQPAPRATVRFQPRRAPSNSIHRFLQGQECTSYSPPCNHTQQHPAPSRSFPAVRPRNYPLPLAQPPNARQLPCCPCTSSPGQPSSSHSRSCPSNYAPTSVRLRGAGMPYTVVGAVLGHTLHYFSYHKRHERLLQQSRERWCT